jgi:predicted alpha/beta superfamily hydrolase
MIEGKPIPLPGAISFTIDSKYVNDQFEIRVFQPPRLPPPADDMGFQVPDAFRVIYTLDANAGFASVVGTTSILPGDPDGGPCEYLIVVGIGYPVTDGEDSKIALLRSRDMTPPGTPEPPEMEMFKQMAGNPDIGFGQADNFLRFLEEELDPLIRREFPCLPDKAGLFGFSYGGLFALYALFSRSPMFDRYIIGSPASVMEGDPILDYEKRCWDEGPELNAEAFVTLGSLERTSMLSGLQLLATNYDKLIARLEQRNYEGLEWSAQEFENESHMSYVILSLSHGLRRLFPGQPSPMMDDVRKESE